MDVNLLVRGQSNALLFVDYGGVWALEEQLESILGDVNINVLAQYGQDDSTIYSGTPFLDWDSDGYQQGLINFLDDQPADILDNPTITLWMHNESDSNTAGVQADSWMAEVQSDATMVREALGQGAETTPYLFTYVPYNYVQGDSPEQIQAGMHALVADSAFNASFDTEAMLGLAMDGDGYADSSHMGRGDADLVAERLVGSLADIVNSLTEGSGATPAPPPKPEAPVAPEPEPELEASVVPEPEPETSVVPEREAPATGGAVFDFNAVEDSPKWAEQTIDWAPGDKIDLSDIPLVGAESPATLHWAGIDPEGGIKAYGVWSWGDGSGTLRVDVDGDRLADMSIVLRGDPSLTEADFVFGTAPEASPCPEAVVLCNEGSFDTFSLPGVTELTTADYVFG